MILMRKNIYNKRTLNYGPMHPITNGEIRLKILLNNEKIEDIEPELGYTHKGIEKLLENNNVFVNTLLVDRLGYFSHLNHELSFMLSFEKLLKIDVSQRAEYIRTIFCESERIISHLMNVTTIAKYIGVQTPYSCAINFKEHYFRFLEKILGKRNFNNFFVPGGVMFDIKTEVLKLLFNFLDQITELLNDIEAMLFGNGIFIRRTSDIGVINKETALSFCLSGVNARASGVKADIRKFEPKTIYNEIDFEILTLTQGDVFSRCILRVKEIKQSIKIIRQCTEKITEGFDAKNQSYSGFHDFKVSFGEKGSNIIDIEKCHYPIKQVYSAVESPGGELGTYFVAEGGPTIYRCKINAPSLNALQVFKKICKNEYLADVGIIFKSLDISPSEIDK